MEEPFFGRRKELAYLEESFRSARSEFIPIYGRRRVGKSTLIQEFLKGKRGVYFVGKQATESIQINAFLTALAEATRQPLLAEINAENWSRVLDLIESHVLKKGRKFVLVLDEFQWIVGKSEELPSLIQERWDRKWKNSGQIMLILCGSYIGFMEREVLGRESPLYGRRSGQILLEPFSYLEAAQFHPRWSRGDQAMAWFLCGGIPYYLNQLKQNLSIEQNIRQTFFNEFSPLFREPDFLLREELREMEVYYTVLMAVANGQQSYEKISKLSGVSEKKLYYYLNQLVELGDILFAIVNLARFLKVDPEQALQGTNRKFLTRFQYVEQRLSESGKRPADSDLEEMDAFWEEAKKALKK